MSIPFLVLQFQEVVEVVVVVVVVVPRSLFWGESCLHTWYIILL
jgi:hypothetical protein